MESAVSRIVPATGPSGLAAFEADLSEAPGTFVPGATVGVDVALRETEGLVVPVDALLEGEDETWVFLVEGAGDTGTVRPVRVRILARSMDEMVVDGGLTGGDMVIVAQPARLMTLAAGMTVEVGGRRHEPASRGGEAAK